MSGLKIPLKKFSDLNKLLTLNMPNVFSLYVHEKSMWLRAYSDRLSEEDTVSFEENRVYS